MGLLTSGPNRKMKEKKVNKMSDKKDFLSKIDKYKRITFKEVSWDKYWNKGYVKRKKDGWVFALIIKYSGLKREDNV